MAGLGERFWSKVKIRSNADCWPWLASKNSQGYGTYRLNGRMCRASRLVAGANDGQVVLHSCDNPTCVNPSHLRVGSAAENVADCRAKGRRASYEGERNNYAKLTAPQVKSIREQYAAIATYPNGRKEYGAAQRIAQRYGITDANLYQIVNRRTWRNV